MKTRVSLLASFLFLVLSWAADAQTIYVTDDRAPGVSTWPVTGSGDVGPTTTITGAATTMADSLGLAIDANAIYVADCDQSSIDVFPINGDGNIAPSRSIRGASTTLNGPGGMAIDESWIYVSDESYRVIVFPINGDGNIAPSRSIQGANTTFDSPYRLALDADWLYVSNRDGHSVLIFPKDGDGNIAPTRSIQGAATGLGAPWGIAVDSSRIYVVNFETTAANILVFPLSASGNASPEQVIQGSATGLQSPNGIAVSQAIPLYEGTIGTEMLRSRETGASALASGDSLAESRMGTSLRQGRSASAGQVVPRSMIWNPISTIRSIGLPSILPKRASAARRPIVARSIRTVDNGGNVWAAKSRSPKPTRARSPGTDSPRACASIRTPWARVSELQKTARGREPRSKSRASPSRPSRKVDGAGTRTVSSSAIPSFSRAFQNPALRTAPRTSSADTTPKLR